MHATGTARKHPLARLALLASPVIYAVSFFLPVLDEPRRSVIGFEVFVSALFIPLVASIFSLASMNPRALVLYLAMLVPWSANLAYWLAVRRELTGQGRRAIVPGVVAVIFGLSALSWLLGPSFGLFANGRAPRGYRVGYWLWLGGMALHALGSLALARARTKEVALAQCWDD
jgi:hypothetical protein